MTDRRLLLATSFLRAFATGLIGVLLGFHLARLDFDATTVGVVVALGLAGATAATLGVTLGADRFGHRRTLVTLALLACFGGALLAASSNPLVIVVAAFLGMVNGMGRDRGAALTLEQAVLPATVFDEERTLAFAQYHVLQDVGHALGSLAAGLPALLARAPLPGSLSPTQATVWIYVALSLLPALIYVRLSPAVEPVRTREATKISPQSRRILWKISSLFAVDGLGGGFLTSTLVAYFFHERFGVSTAEVGALFFGARVANALSHLGAAWLARRIGLVNTMVFTHLPSSLLLVTVAIAPTFPIAAVLFLIREGLVEMDVPTRQSYVMAVVQPSERTVASGVTHLVRLGSWAVAPALAGVFMEHVSLAAPLAIGATMKISYDLLLFKAFRNLKPPEERS